MRSLMGTIAETLSFVALQFVVIVVVQSSVVAGDNDRSLCPDLGPLHRGSRREFYGGTTMVYRCNEGYTMSGSNVVRCSSTGEWDHPKPICIRSGCPYPGRIRNGRETNVGNIITYECHDGYEMRGPDKIYCDGENWSSKVPECVQATIPSFAKVSFCQDPGEVENSERNDYENEGAVTYRCAFGFERIGNPVIRCLVSGEWNSPKPACAKTGCAPPPPVTNAYSQIKHQNKVIQYTCYEGYTLRGSSAVFCNGQRWNDTTPECVPVGGVGDSQGEVPQGGGDTESEIDTDVGNYDVLDRVEDGQNCEGAPRIRLATFKYIRREDSLGNLYYVAKYICIAQYRLVEGDAELYCSQRQWIGSPPVCEHENPCSVHNGGCQDQCEHDENGRARCVCRHGYRLENQRNCVDIDECLDNGGHGPCSHTCQNRIGTFKCGCPEGYKLKEDAITCEDMNECVESQPDCLHGTCVNTVGSYRCLCNTGFYMADDGQCTDIDECMENNGGCEFRCRNTLGSYTCLCRGGYELSEDRHSCVDRNECLLPRYKQLCPHGCENTRGSFHCLCPPGFTLAPNRIHCVDINECAENSGLGPCEQYCANTAGSFWCSCTKPGYRLARDGMACEEIDACLDESTCGHICVNFPGGYRCSCNPGYILLPDERTCEGCRINSYKSDTENECTECPANSHTKSPGKTSISDCVCNSGFEGDPGQNILCQDIDECENNNNGCSDECTNTPGSAYCGCPDGFQLQWPDLKVCVDIDECSRNGGGCEQNCLNTVGGFECSCNDGYIIDPDDPYTCADIDECEEDNGGCSQRCVNYPGGYLCECDEVSVISEDGKSCEQVVCSAFTIPPHGKIKPKAVCIGQNPNKPLVVGTVCTFACLKGHVLSGTVERTCENTGHWSGTEVTCTRNVCPNLQSPENGRILPASCGGAPSRYRTQCTFACNDGYELVGNRVTKCQYDRTWSKEPATCVKQDVNPTITCANDLTVDLLPGASSIIISITSPISNTENIRANRPTTNTTFSAGRTAVHYTAISGDGTRNASCVVNVNVIDNEPPVATHCPEPLYFETGTQYPTNITWDVPVFTDNVGVVEEWSSRDPGGAFTWGVYNVVYVAKDAANNAAECSFTIAIEPTSCGQPDGPMNGVPDCAEWLYGQICNPRCNDGYVFYAANSTNLYMCGADGTWSPSQTVPDCTEYVPMINNRGLCPPGYELRSYPQSLGIVCVKCPRGMFFVGDTNVCTDCPVGTYQDEFGQTSCRQCPSGRSTATIGSKSQSDCTATDFKGNIVDESGYTTSEPSSGQ